MLGMYHSGKGLLLTYLSILIKYFVDVNIESG